MDRKDWCLLALALTDDGRLSPVQIQKTLFLMAEEARSIVGRGRFYKFIPHNWGPFSVEIYSDLDAMIEADLVARDRARSGLQVYAITKKGMDRAAELREGAAKAERRGVDYLAEAVRWVTDLDFPDLLRAIYAKYPKYAVNSLFRDR